MNIQKNSKYLSLLLQYWKYGFFSILSYRKSFLFQSGFMILNNCMLLGIFFLFFHQFKSIGGMTLELFIPLFATNVIIFGCIHTLFGGYSDIARKIRNGEIDSYLLTPKSPLLKLLVSRMEYSALGDFFSGFLFLAWFTPQYLGDIEFLIRLFLIATIGTVTFLGCLVFYHSLGFFLKSAEGISESAFHATMGSSLYPPEVFQGIIKLIYLSVFPTFWVIFYPYKFLISDGDFGLLVVCILASIIFFMIGSYTFSIGLRRYESGNLITTNR